jgi:hypothetical protein
MTEKILLGFYVPTGEPVYLGVHHLAIFGMTQLSGKTTALEALISRSGLRAIAFKTKRGEAGFTTFNSLTPYYKPRADWQFVEGLVNVALGEKVKFEPGMRYAIMKVCRGRKDLKDIQLAARGMAKTDKSAFMRSVYEKLDEYLEIVIPELEKWTFAETLELTEGVNVMDLSGMRLETQHIVIASTIEYAFANLDHVVVIIPEAWETIPQGKMTPVKWVAQQFIRKGAALGNYLWLDSQDIGGIDKTPLRQCDNWLMGRMKEAHEVERILKQLLGMKVPAEEIQTLPLGHFYAAIGNDVKKVYVLPNGVPEEVGRSVALGEMAPECVRDRYLKPSRVLEDTNLDFKQAWEDEKHKREEAERLSDSKAQEKIEAFKQEFAENFVSRKDFDELQKEKAELLEDAIDLEEFKRTLAKLIGSVTTSTPGAISSLSVADVDERINQRLSQGPGPIPVVSVDVDQRIKELVKNEVLNRVISKIKALPDPAKKAAWWLHEKKQASIKELYNYVNDKSEIVGRVSGAFYMNVINPLVDAWLIVNEGGSIRWNLQEKLAAELKEVLTNSDFEKVPKYLTSLLL